MIRKICNKCGAPTIIVPTPDTRKNGVGPSGVIEMHEICSKCNIPIESYPDQTFIANFQLYMQLLCAALQNQRTNIREVNESFFKELNHVYALTKKQLKLISEQEVINEQTIGKHSN